MPVPKSGSKNPVLGFVKCPTPNCCEVATVHQPKGNRKHLRYFICPECGTNQQTGQVIQKYIRANMRDTMAEVETVETTTEQGSEAEAVTVKPEKETETETAKPTVETAANKAKSQTAETVKSTVEAEPAKPISIKWGIVGFFSLLGIAFGVTRS
jgi:ElaB/YqjD/DUF883 family membrane-anchored ribosome-binding protein/predicted RNA-binding Zn-ribbon protein involved in translation (DUF1610 family)